jgi:ligand-binding sensor domain-containing protein
MMRTIFLFLALLLAAGSYAQKKIRLQQFSIEDGLSQNTINTIFQDSRGFMWFGTQNGLNRYDGIAFTTYKNLASDSNSISSSDVYAAYEDADKITWFGTRSGLSRFNRDANNFSNYDFYEGGQYAMRPAWCIAGSPKNEYLWIGASGGLFRFSRVTKKFNHYRINDSIQNANSVRALCQDKKGRLWVGTSIGELMQFDETHGTFTLLNSSARSKGKEYNAITCILQDNEGNIWIGKEDGVLVRFEDAHGTFQEYTALKNKYPVRAMLEDKEGNLWIGTDKGGTFLLNKRTGVFTPLGERQENGTDVVLSFYNDVKGDMWLGTYHGGAYLFDKTDTAFTHLQPYHEIRNSDESNSVLAICQDRNGLWMGTDGGGLIRKEKGTTHYYKKAGSNSIAGNTILCLAERAGELYIGTYANGLSVFIPSTGRFTTYDQSNGLSDNSVWTLYVDGDAIWIGTNKGGLNLFDVKSRKFRHFTNTLKDEHTISSNTIRSIFKDSRNKLWIGTVSGLNVFNEEDSTFTSFYHHEGENSISNNNVLCVYEDAEKNLWMGTHGGGINRYDYRTGVFTDFQEEDGLAGNIVYGILEDVQGNLWLSTNKGISRLDVRKKEFTNFDTRAGLTSAEFNTGASFKNKEGRMFFGNIQGATSFLPHHIRQNTFVPPVVITDFFLFNKPVPIGPQSPLQRAIGETAEIALDHTQSVFSLRFAALNFTHSDKNSYAYQLEPFDKEWIYAGHVNSATYTNLDPGTYTFKVKASNNDGVWNESFTTLTIVITPPFWKTLWFNALVVVFIALVLYGAYRFKVSSIRKQKEILTSLVDQRTAEIEEKNKLLLETQMKHAQLIHQKLNDELEARSKELTNYALLIIQKNRLLEELKMKLKEVIRHPGSSNLRDFRNLVQMINYNFSPEKEWKEFSANFNRVHGGFSETLKAKFPDLTNNDLRLCALYRISIPSRDIAEAMGISSTSVKMARYRLRKKLGLSPEEDISKFLNTLG